MVNAQRTSRRDNPFQLLICTIWTKKKNRGKRATTFVSIDRCTCLVICNGAFPIASALNADPDMRIARLKRPAKDGKTINGFYSLEIARYLHARQILSFSFYSIIIDIFGYQGKHYSLRHIPPLKNDRRIHVYFVASKKGLFFPDDFTRKSNVCSLWKVDFIAIFNGNGRELWKNLEYLII